ncbi:hypothetical protein D043_5071B, partial [Vibrio parahaemolyticus EKP-021]
CKRMMSSLPSVMINVTGISTFKPNRMAIPVTVLALTASFRPQY